MRKRVWFSPVPLVGFKAVAKKCAIGWWVTWREFGECAGMWFPRLSDEQFVERGRAGP